MLQPLALSLALALSPLAAQEGRRDPEAVALLEAAVEAGRAIRNVSYEVHSEVRQGDKTSIADGQVCFAKLPPGAPVGARLHVRGRSPEAGPGGGDVAFRVAFDGELARGRFGDESVVWQAPIPGDGLEILQIAELLILAELYAEEPFATALTAEKIALGEEVELGGVRCRGVRVEHGPAQKNAKIEWFLSLDDHLPRKRVGEVHRRGVFQVEVLELSKLQINPMIHQALFRLPTPAGVEVREFVSSRPKGPELLAIGSEAPAFSLKDAGGEEHSLSDFRGSVLVLDFWATWCPPCRQAMPLVQKIHERFADEERVVVYGVATNERPGAKPAEFMSKGGFTYGLLLSGESISAAYKAVALPTFYVIGTDGTVLHASVGFDPRLDVEIIGLIERHLSGEGGE